MVSNDCYVEDPPHHPLKEEVEKVKSKQKEENTEENSVNIDVNLKEDDDDSEKKEEEEDEKDEKDEEEFRKHMKELVEDFGFTVIDKRECAPKPVGTLQFAVSCPICFDLIPIYKNPSKSKEDLICPTCWTKINLDEMSTKKLEQATRLIGVIFKKKKVDSDDETYRCRASDTTKKTEYAGSFEETQRLCACQMCIDDLVVVNDALRVKKNYKTPSKIGLSIFDGAFDCGITIDFVISFVFFMVLFNFILSWVR